jgi:hypothetical protein
MSTKIWRPFQSECLHCGDVAEVLTDSRQDNLAYDGDQARCTGCGCPGMVVVEEDDTAEIRWHDEPTCSCAWCLAHSDPTSQERTTS